LRSPVDSTTGAVTDIGAARNPRRFSSPAQASRGIVQTIPTTFAAYHAAGTSNNIYDPEASFGAGINYMKDRYNIGTDGSGLDEFYAARSRGNYVGY
ncbi:transglycosylase SLT domain-containing protein, partial [Rhodococcus pyridinivorans]|uniref:transglycosylase SLT domain-containing protein n=1 Tax=Rhodococcus pyridinivorans TaxID=103816 RepID=UPI00265B16C0